MNIKTGNGIQSPLLVPLSQVWTGIIEMPRVPAAMIKTLLLHEIGKAFPGEITDLTTVRWELLDGLFAGLLADHSFFLVHIPLEPVAGQGSVAVDAPQAGITGLQVLIRLWRRKNLGTLGFLAVAGANDTLILGIDGTGRPQVIHDAWEPNGGTDSAQGQPHGHSLIYLDSPQAATDQLLAAARALGAVQVFTAQNFPWKLINFVNLFYDGTGELRRAKYGLAAAVVFCLAAGLFLGWRWYANQADEYQRLQTQVRAITSGVALSQADKAKISQLETELGLLRVLVPVNVYDLIQQCTGTFQPGDRILSLRWDAAARIITVELLSRDPVRVLTALQKAGNFQTLTNTGIVPFTAEPGFFQCAISGGIGAP